MRIGILTSGGDCPGINATIRGVCKTAINHYGMEVVGIHSGFQGLLTKDVESFTDKSLSGLLNQGGTMLGTSREKPFKKNGVISDVNKPALIEQNIKELGLDCVVCIGGNGTQKTAAKLAAMGLNIVSVPKTIDNDIWGTDFSFGFDSAVSIATDAIDRLHSTASSHKRVMESHRYLYYIVKVSHNLLQDLLIYVLSRTQFFFLLLHSKIYYLLLSLDT